ncbi:Uncharacterized protein K02A2.6 [Stylophora pistillata]|uniref:Uncharacterized protein K02A2.6 n=1 Tax=Stylophora pistillata TaxID=50429 RepID=A0A2B4S136_STYPI|nr:Uncharacterized protein K02A2.6 [Stylophora pistillata]
MTSHVAKEAAYEYTETDDWCHYIERVNHFFEANEITDPDKQRSIFLVSVGAKIYKLIRSLVALEDPKYRSYEDLATLAQEHFMPKPSAIVQRFKFNTRTQQPGHLSRVCQAKKKGKPPPPSNNKKSDTPQDTHLLEGGEKTMGRKQDVGAYSLFTLGGKRPAPYKVQLSVNGQALEMKVDTGASFATIEKLKTTFASHGLPEIAVSDNGSNFVSSEFKSFLHKNGITHITSAPYHPSSNGLVERAVQTFKQGMKKQGDGTAETKLARFLLSYRITPQSTTGESPAQLRWGQSLRSHLDLLRPDVAAKVHAAQSRQKIQHDQLSWMRRVEVGDSVGVRKYSRGPKWIPGTIIQETGPLSARIELEDGTVVRRHHDQLVARPTEKFQPWCHITNY